MSNQYAGGFISKTPPTVTRSSAQGMWTLSQQAQYQKDGVWPVFYGWPVANVGDAYGGGFFAGQINVSGTKYNLVVAPKSTGESSSKTWGVYGTTTGVTSVINGPTNSASLAALGASYQAAKFCEDLNIGAYSDWYLPAKNELEVLYYFLKPSTDANDTGSGSNANAVFPPEPVSTNYTSGSPAQTSAGTSWSTNSFTSGVNYWSSTEGSDYGAYVAWRQDFLIGGQTGGLKNANEFVRAVRRVLA
jgi:hypothetical protein